MKREQIKTLLDGVGVPEDKQKDFIDAVMKLNNETIQNEQAKTKAKEDELSKAQDQIKSLNDTVQSFGGKTPEELNRQLSDLQKKYDTDLAEARKKYDDTIKTTALKEALAGEGVTDVDYLIYKAGGIDKFAFADGKPVGISDTIKPFKESNPALFKTEEKKSFGMRHEGGNAPDTQTGRENVNNALRQAFGTKN